MGQLDHNCNAEVDAQVLLLIVYRLTIHPLAEYPGPLLARITNLYSVYHAYIGDLHLDMLRCHETYGKIARPNLWTDAPRDKLQTLLADAEPM